MEFEFDPAKSVANKAKHGIDFVEAQALWKNEAVVRTLPHLVEVRMLRINQIGEKIWAAVFTLRKGRIRLISVRRARRDEEAEYGQHGKTLGRHDNEH